jgi:hypothetical protein
VLQNCGKIFVSKKSVTKREVMKKERFISAVLGISQKDVAMLLQVNRSQLSLHELGKRDLPVSAKVLLTDLLDEAQQLKSAKETRLPQLVQQQQRKEALILRLLKENTRQLLSLSRKLEKMEQMHDTQLKALLWISNLTAKTENKDPLRANVLKSITNKALRKLDRCGLPELTHLKIRIAVLQEEARLLNEALTEN